MNHANYGFCFITAQKILFWSLLPFVAVGQYPLTWGGGNNCVTFMGDVAKWRLPVTTKDFIKSILYNPCTGLIKLSMYQ